jgi:uncharacterized RDD family membrane protein YckC
VSTFALSADQASLEPAGSIQASNKAIRVKLLPDLGRPRLWTGDDLGGSSALFIRGDDSWSAPINLPVPMDVLSKADAADVTVAGQSIRLLLLVDAEAANSKIVEFSFAADGTGRGRSEIPVPSASSGDQQRFEWLSAIAVAMLMMVLLNSMRAPRPVVDPAKLQEAGVVLAPYGLRILAATIDALPILITMAVVLVALNTSAMQNSQAVFDAVVDATKWPRVLSAGGYIFHTMLTEVLWGWTIGKRLCGLRAVTLAGTTPTRLAFVWRNLLRLIDVAMGFPALLIFISPLRQRVGDIAAGTIVVMKADAKTPPIMPSDDQDA